MSTMNPPPMQHFHSMPQQYSESPYDETFLLLQLRSQIEFYFCPQNLAKDKFLLSHLNSTEHLGAVPIEVLCTFPKVRQIHALARMGNIPTVLAPPADPQMVRSALHDSTVVSVSDDGLWVSPKDFLPRPTDIEKPKDTAATVTTVASAPSSPSSQATGSSSLGVPTHPLPLKERNTVIVRDIPENVTRAQVIETFSTESTTPKSARPDVGNTWYVTFETEEQAVAALAATRERKIAGAPVRARLKAKDPYPPDLKNVPIFPNLPQQQRQPTAVQYPMVPPPYSLPHPMAQQFIPPPPYGYFQYPYSMIPPPPQPMTARMQQQYFQQPPHGFQYIQSQPPRPQGYQTNPPPHVFVKPKQQHEQQQQLPQQQQLSTIRKPNKRGRKGRNRQNQETVEDNRSQPRNAKNEGKKHLKRKTKKKDDTLDLTAAEHFPALVNTPAKRTTTDAPTGYAQALLKQPQSKPPPQSRPAPSAPPEGELEHAMSKLAFTDVTSASYDDW